MSKSRMIDKQRDKEWVITQLKDVCEMVTALHKKADDVVQAKDALHHAIENVKGELTRITRVMNEEAKHS